MSASARAASVNAYLDELAGQRRLSPHTVSNYRHDLETLCALIGELPSDVGFAAIETHHIRRFIAILHTRGIGGRSLGRTLSAWRGFYSWLVQRGMTTLNPVESVRPPKSPKALPMMSLSVAFVCAERREGLSWPRDLAATDAGLKLGSTGAR